MGTGPDRRAPVRIDRHRPHLYFKNARRVAIGLILLAISFGYSLALIYSVRVTWKFGSCRAFEPAGVLKRRSAAQYPAGTPKFTEPRPRGSFEHALDDLQRNGCHFRASLVDISYSTL